MEHVETVFVYADGKVGLKPLNAKYASLPMIRVPVVGPVGFQQNYEGVSPTPCFGTEDYTRKGRMFDGRPVFCAKGFDLKLMGIDWLVTARDIAEGRDDMAREEAEWQMKSLAPTAIMLDHRIERESPDPETLVAARRAKRLVAVKQ